MATEPKKHKCSVCGGSHHWLRCPEGEVTANTCDQVVGKPKPGFARNPAPVLNMEPEEISGTRWARIRLEIELSYDADLMHSNEPEDIAWFRDEILKGNRGKLTLHSGEIGDEIGRVTVTEIKS